MARGACLLFMSAVFLSGCLDPPAAVGGSTNSGVRGLKVGMSPSKVAGIIGTYQVEKTSRLPGRILAAVLISTMNNNCVCGSFMCFFATKNLFPPQMAT